MQEYLSYKNVDKMKALVTKLLYSKITWWTRNLSIALVNLDVVSKKYLMYYLDIIPVIQFLISNWLFASQLAYAAI